MGAKIAAALLAAATMSGCAHTPVNRAGCNLVLLPLDVEHATPVANSATAGTAIVAPSIAEPRPGSYEAAIEAAMAPEAPTPQPPTPGALLSPPPRRAPVLLFLSGGSQNGAYGAGFLDAWRESAGGALPPFRLVTGISTGALIGSAVFTGASERAVAGYTINSEADLLDVRARGLLAQVRAGAVGTLEPLRRKIDTLLDDQPGDDAVLGRVADAAAETPHRKFLVGVVDARIGEAFAVDMTDLATRWKVASNAGDTLKRDAIKQCYLDVLIASSSAPLAAPPVYIDGHMFVDGGVRFGAFRTAQSAAMNRARTRPRAARTHPPVSFLIVNSRLDIAAQPTTEADGSLRKWSILDLGFRSIEILTNQNQRFSAVLADADDSTSIAPEADQHLFNGTSCADWRKLDDADKPRPVQFHKREMLCLIDFGRSVGRAARWWKKY